jgi:hypothetical protein
MNDNFNLKMHGKTSACELMGIVYMNPDRVSIRVYIQKWVWGLKIHRKLREFWILKMANRENMYALFGLSSPGRTFHSRMKSHPACLHDSGSIFHSDQDFDPEWKTEWTHLNKHNWILYGFTRMSSIHWSGTRMGLILWWVSLSLYCTY